MVTLTITDNGPGVDQGIRETLFEPFVSAGRQKGTGLGLTLTASIVAEHGGSAELVDSHPGETIFSHDSAARWRGSSLRRAASGERGEGGMSAKVQGNRSARVLRMPTAVVCLALATGSGAKQVLAQETNSGKAEQQMMRLAAAVAKTEAELQASQQQLQELRRELEALRQQMAREHAAAETTKSDTTAGVQSSANADAATARKTDEIGERQALQESQIATLDQSKVESESKYPVKLSGLILLTGFTNTAGVDIPSTPTFAADGTGSTGASLRQTILGVDARGPHLLGARSDADVRVDFSANANGAGYGGGSGVARLRTAHAALHWNRTVAWFALDRPLISPNVPTSLTAVAVPALGWSGNLWNWNPQLGVTHDVSLAGARQLRLQAALMDVSDPPSLASPAAPAANTVQPSLAERSRWPGVETRVALRGAAREDAAEFGFGGYFSPHQTIDGIRFNAWAGTVDLRLPLPARLELSGSGYLGQALGGLGGGGYKDYAYRTDPSGVFVQALDDAGGWTQLKQRLGQRLEWNAAFGLDNVFAGQLRPYASAAAAPYQNLARNRTATGNVIYRPSAYLLFSFEYRHLESAPVIGPASSANIFGIAAGYKF